VIVKLLPQQLQSILTHAESTYPEECCGILFGHLAKDGKTVVEVMPTENAWSAEAAEYFPETELANNKTRRYAIAPQVLLQAQRQARDRSLDIIGIYHSHTDHPAIPSEFDRVCAWEQYSYIIVSVANGKACDLKSWCLDDSHQFQPEEIQNLS
jgi:proteasome lid subunit RPN8/RPN11